MDEDYRQVDVWGGVQQTMFLNNSDIQLFTHFGGSLTLIHPYYETSLVPMHTRGNIPLHQHYDRTVYTDNNTQI